MGSGSGSWYQLTHQPPLLDSNLSDRPPSQSHMMPRLGKGVARVTTRYRMRHHREARQFLRAALRDDRAAAESSSRVNKFCVDQANLTPVLAYLGQQ